MAEADRAAIATRLAAARSRLILERPFIGALIVHLPAEPAAWTPSFATDARRIWFNPDYIERLSFREIQFVLAHAALHCALGHFARRGHRVRRRWDIACDHAVNLLLAEEGMQAPPGALLDLRFRAMVAEEIYPLIRAEDETVALDAHLFDAAAGGSGRAGEGAAAVRDATSRAAGIEDATQAHSADEHWSDAGSHARRHPGAGRAETSAPALDDLAQAWQLRLAGAAQQARYAGRLGASWQRLFARHVAPQLSWRAILARYLARSARDDYSFQRPSRREGDALLPRLASEQLELYVVIDTSGSLGEAELAEFAAELDALKAQVSARVTVHACDRALAPQGPWVYQPWEPIVLPQQLAGGGGTDFAPPFAWIARESLRPDVLVYFTDGEGDFPAAAPAYPVIWIVKGRAAVPWGERVQLN